MQPEYKVHVMAQKHAWALVYALRPLECSYSPNFSGHHHGVLTFTPLEAACLLALSSPSWMAVNTTLSLLSTISETVAHLEPSSWIWCCASGVRISKDSPVSGSSSHYGKKCVCMKMCLFCLFHVYVKILKFTLSVIRQVRNCFCSPTTITLLRNGISLLMLSSCNGHWMDFHTTR